MDTAPELLHATAIALDADHAALLIGESGSGKSDLALRCILHPIQDAGRQISAHLVSDDQVHLHRLGSHVIAQPPPTIAGLLEVRGVGILPQPHIPEARVTLIVELVPGRPIERLPDPWPAHRLLDADLPLLRIDPREASAPAKILLVLARGIPS